MTESVLLDDASLAPRARRYSLELPVEIGPLRGTTRDISISGIRLETDEPGAATLRPGDALQLVLLFPSTVYGRSYRLHIDGRVMRIEPAGGRLSIALCTELFRFGEAIDPADLPLMV
jgi:hypothetical protein